MNKQTKPSSLFILLMLMLLWPTQALLAHGGGLLQVSAEPAGPYKVSVWTSPARLEANNSGHITVSVADEADAPVLDAAVLVQLQSLETDEIMSVPATTAQSTNKLFYEADMILPEVGRYSMTIQVNGTEGSGEITFPVEVQPAGNTSWFLVGFIVLGLAISMFLFRMWEKQPAEPVPRRK
jgi:hypothetical protein